MKLRMSSAHHLQTDGQTEVVNWVVEMVVRCTLHNSSKPTHWAKDLSLVELFINNNPLLSMGYTPFYLNYGYYSATPLGLLRDSATTAVEGVKTFSRAKRMLQKAQERQKIQATNKKREQRSIWVSRCY